MGGIDAELVAVVASAYGLGVPVGEAVYADRGELGRVWRLDTDRGSWALKDYGWPVEESAAQADVAFQLSAAAAGLPLPLPRQARDGRRQPPRTGPTGAPAARRPWPSRPTSPPPSRYRAICCSSTLTGRWTTGSRSRTEHVPAAGWPGCSTHRSPPPAPAGYSTRWSPVRWLATADGCAGCGAVQAQVAGCRLLTAKRAGA